MSGPFQLPPFPPVLDFPMEKTNRLLLLARIELAELNGYSHAIPNPLLLMSPWVIREAVASSEIENINTTVIRAMQNDLLPDAQRDVPNKEVLRYRDALIWGFENLGQLPLSGRMIRGMHQQLMPASEGFRRMQNYIQNSLTKEVIYTPPPPNQIAGLIGNLEYFYHEAAPRFDPLVRAAVAHYQFEAIHPFSDGNGRIGRMLMVLQLVNEKVLRFPVLYISGYINRNKAAYYRALRGVSEQNDWETLVVFLLRGFYEQAKSTKETLFELMEYRQFFMDKIKTEQPGLYSTDLVDLLFSKPILSAVKYAEEMGVHRVTASRNLQLLADAKLLRTLKEGRKVFYVNHRLLEILSSI